MVVVLSSSCLSLSQDEIAVRFQMRTRRSVSESLRRSRDREQQEAGFRVQLATIRERTTLWL